MVFFQDKRIRRSFLAVMFSMIVFLGVLPLILAQFRALPLNWKLFAGAYPLQITYIFIAFYFAGKDPAGNILQTLDLVKVPFRVLLRTAAETTAVFFLLSLITGIYLFLLQKFQIDLPLQTVVQLLKNGPPSALWILLPAAIIAAPVGEELAFRHIIYKKFCSLLPPGPAALFCSLIFAAVHLNLQSFPALFLLGIYLCRLSQRYRSLLPCILAHCLFNTITVLIVLAMRFQILPGS